jgi:hypothetical protein
MKHIPIHHRVIKQYSSPRGSYDQPLLVRLRTQHHNTYAVGFKERIVAYDGIEEEIENWPIGYGFTGGLTRTKP